MTGTSHALTLGVVDTERSTRFYEQALGCSAQAPGRGFVRLRLPDGRTDLALYDWAALAADSHVDGDSSGFRGVMLSYVVHRPDEVDTLVSRAQLAGGELVRAPHGAFWGYSAHFRDPDGHIWKVAAPPARRLGRRAAYDEQVATAPIPPTKTAVTLAASDFTRAKEFYAHALGLAVDKSFPGFVSFTLGDGEPTLSLYKRKALAKDAGVNADGRGFSGTTLSIITASATDADAVMSAAREGGATVTHPASAAAWGGYAGSFLDPEGYAWKVAAA